MDLQASAHENVVSVDPFRCRMWKMHDRLDDHISEASCAEEIRSFEKHGQLVAALARPLLNDPDHSFELIYGARRLFIARHLNRPLKVLVREISDAEALVAMDSENRHRKDISAYERGRSFARWLSMGFFGCQDEIALALGVSTSQVSRLLKVARLPTVIVAAFASPMDIREGWGLELVDACEDVGRRSVVIRRARQIAGRSPRPVARAVFDELIAQPSDLRRSRASRAHDEVVCDASGSPLFRVRRQRQAVALLLPLEAVTRHSLQHIKLVVSAALLGASLDGSDRDLQSESSQTLDDKALEIHIAS